MRRKRAALFILLCTALISQTSDTIPETRPRDLGPKQAAAYVETDFPWSMFHHDPAHGGFTWARASNNNTLLWNVATGGAVSSSPSVVDGLVYVGSSDGLAYALNESSGGTLWTWRTGGAVTASPAVYGGTTYVTSQDGTIYALAALTGQLRWSSIQIAPLASSPTVSDGMVFFGTQFSVSVGTAQVVSLNATTGATIWSFLWPASIPSSPAVDQGRVFIGTGNGWIVALDQLSGRPLWQYQTGTTSVSSPAVSSGTVYLTTTSNRVFALEKTAGVLRWSQSFGGAQNPTPSSPALAGDALVFGTGRSQIIALNATTGATLWTRNTAGAVSSSPALTVDTVIVGSNDMRVYALNLATGGVRWTYATGGAVSSSPAIADGLIFFGSQDGKVYAIGPPVPILQLALNASPSRLRSGLASTVTVTVTANSLPQKPIELTVTADLGNTTLPNYTGPGVYVLTYSSPFVGGTTVVTLTALAAEPGFLTAQAQATITVDPPSPITLNLAVSPVSIGPSDTAKLMVQVLNGSLPVVGAKISTQSTLGGNFSAVNDLGNGNYTVSYTPPQKDFKDPTGTTILVGASKPGFMAASDSARLVVFGSLPRPVTLPELPGLPIILVGLSLFASAICAFWIKSRRGREKPRPLEDSLAFGESLLRAVDAAFELVGPNVWNAILRTVQTQYGVRKEEIPDKLEAFNLGLIATLGQGAPLVERVIVKKLYAELGFNDPPLSQDDFVTKVRNAQAIFLNPKKRKRSQRLA